jgi:hypothetical protein
MPHLESPRAAAPHHCLRLTGSLSSLAGSAHNLVNVRLGNNSLRGVLPINMTTNSQLLNLELYDNVELYGTLPDMKHLLGLRTLDLHNTSFHGVTAVYTHARARASQHFYSVSSALCSSSLLFAPGGIYITTQHSTMPFMSAHSTAQHHSLYVST